MKRSPEELEKLLHQTLRRLPDRRAPRSLESRVLAAIEARATLPWWRQSFARWPIAARCVFLLFCGGLVKVALMVAVWAFAGFNAAELSRAFESPYSWVQAANGAFRTIADLLQMLVRGIPPAWLYGTLAVIAGLYVTLFGLGATAYRTLFAERRI